MSDTQALLAALGKPFPREAIKTRVGGGGTKFDYVAGHTIIHRLNDATGGKWSWHVKSFDFRPAGTDRYGKEVSLVVVTGELTIDGLGTRAGIGVQKVTENGGEDLVKGASTDALKKAATLFGVALELYGEDYEDADFDHPGHTDPMASPTYDLGRRPQQPRRAEPAPTPRQQPPAQRNAPAPVIARTGATQPHQRHEDGTPAAAPEGQRPPRSDEELLAIIGNLANDETLIFKAAATYLGRAKTVAELNQRDQQLGNLPETERRRLYKAIHDRLLLPTAGAAG